MGFRGSEWGVESYINKDSPKRWASGRNDRGRNDRKKKNRMREKDVIVKQSRGGIKQQ